ncbi:IclR family transcriptional regulator [Nocardioides pacificus]
MVATAVEAAGERQLPPSMVERMTLILDTFEGRSSRLTLEEVARRTHLPRSTAHRILDQLVRLQWLEHSSFGYALGRRSLELGGGDHGHADIRAAAAPLLHELLMKTGAVVHLAVLDGAQVYYLDKVGGRFAAAVPSRVGGRAPLHCTALGKAMLAWIDAEDVDMMVGSRLSPHTEQSISDLNRLHRELTKVRSRSGLAFERGECFPDIACAAAAVRGPDGPLAAISLVGDADTQLERVAPLVVDAARQISMELFPGIDRTPGNRRRPTGRPAGERRVDDRADWSPEKLSHLMTVQAGDLF